MDNSTFYSIIYLQLHPCRIERLAVGVIINSGDNTCCRISDKRMKAAKMLLSKRGYDTFRHAVRTAFEVMNSDGPYAAYCLHHPERAKWYYNLLLITAPEQIDCEYGEDLINKLYANIFHE